MKRYIGIDLHKNQFTVCYRDERENEKLRRYAMSQLDDFKKTLCPEDEIGLEATGNSTHFRDAVASKPGKDRGATILLGSKAPILEGAQMSSVMVPFMRMEPPYGEDEATYEDLPELVDNIWELWGEEGKNRERVGEFIQRIGMGNFLDAIGLEPVPEMIAHPRTNPYVFYELDKEEEEGNSGDE